MKKFTKKTYFFVNLIFFKDFDKEIESYKKIPKQVRDDGDYHFSSAQWAVACLALNWTKQPHSAQVI